MSSNPTREPAVLTSWKEIAAYLGKGVRTVQRWEKDDGLPVRRISGTSKIVMDRRDLDHWLHAQPSQLPGTPSSNLPSAIAANIAMSKALRQAQADLRHSLNSAMLSLMDECRRMTSALADLGQRNPEILTNDFTMWRDSSRALTRPISNQSLAKPTGKQLS